MIAPDSVNGTKLWDSTIGRYGAADWVKNNALSPKQELVGYGKHKGLHKLRNAIKGGAIILIAVSDSENDVQNILNAYAFLWLLAPGLAAIGAPGQIHKKLVNSIIW
ncbi:hypothetical protein [Leptospira interrogans]|uniref:hypothetical protein n=1 Tax=Leptospira interrogans TaxID=173 RepID=UPI001F258AC3